MGFRNYTELAFNIVTTLAYRRTMIPFLYLTTINLLFLSIHCWLKLAFRCDFPLDLELRLEPIYAAHLISGYNHGHL